MPELKKLLRSNFVIIGICIVAFLLRIKGMMHQSLWVDELGAMNESDPRASWSTLFDTLRCCDIQPPLFFIFERFSFALFGYTEQVAKLTCVLAGTIGVYAMYLLGKEILNKQLGNLCAAITCINYFHIYYSQEVRPYIFAFLFATLSMYFFIRLLNKPGWRNLILYAVAALLILYTHYYGLFIVAAQVIIMLICSFEEQGANVRRLWNAGRYFIYSGLIIFIGYLPWFSFLLSSMKYKSGWIPLPATTFLADYFWGYFGQSEILKPILLILLILFVVGASLHSRIERRLTLKENSLILATILVIIWIGCVLIIPYVWSYERTPMLHPRYTIVAVPAIILVLAYSIELFKSTVLKYIFISVFILLSSIDLFEVQHYYSAITKTQFREMTGYVVTENKNEFPIINGTTAWYQQYYLSSFGSKAELLTEQKETFIDSIKKGSKYAGLNGFWLVGAHGEKMPGENERKGFDSTFALYKENQFYDAWAQLYVSRKYIGGKFIMVPYSSFSGANAVIYPGEHQISLFGGSIDSKPISLTKGKYKITVVAKGTKAANEFAHLSIYSNGTKIASFYLTESLEQRSFDFILPVDGNAVLKVTLDNDFYQPPNEDRNAFLTQVTLEHN
ncbi:MAG: glycosyltransferase family 39 protein [Bacteroidota bacterium]